MKTILTGWHFMRMVRLLLGIGIIVQGVENGDWAVGLLGGLFVVLAVTNTACCGANGCTTPRTFKQKTELSGNEYVEYEELSDKN
jgi:hypothetical protein